MPPRGACKSGDPVIPDRVVSKIEAGEELTEAELRCLIDAEAALLGLTGSEAVERARRGDLGGSYLAADLELLASMLPEVK